MKQFRLNIDDIDARLRELYGLSGPKILRLVYAPMGLDITEEHHDCSLVAVFLARERVHFPRIVQCVDRLILMICFEAARRRYYFAS